MNVQFLLKIKNLVAYTAHRLTLILYNMAIFVFRRLTAPDMAFGKVFIEHLTHSFRKFFVDRTKSLRYVLMYGRSLMERFRTRV